jgi:hypothetical protein
LTEPADKPKKPRGFAAMSPGKAAAIRAKGAFTSDTGRKVGEASRKHIAARNKAAPALEAALEALYELAKAYGVSESRIIMKNAAAALKSARGETETKE